MLIKDLNQQFHQLTNLVCESISIFRHFDAQRIALSIGASRSSGKSGIWAHVVPLRYIGGKATRKGKRFGVTGVYSYDDEKIRQAYPDARYLMTFMTPRFFGLSFEERLETIIHELYHIHPTQRGDLRRFPKPHTHHGPTPRAYDRRVRELMKECLGNFPEIKHHPLLVGTKDDFMHAKKRRLNIPQMRFSRVLPEQGSLFRNLLFIILMLFLGSLMASANNRRIHAINNGKIYAAPDDKSRVKDYFSVGESFQFSRFDPTGRWALIKERKFSGWVLKYKFSTRKSAVPRDSKLKFENPYTPENTNQVTFTGDGREVYQYEVIQSGSFYKQPRRSSQQYGLLKEGDKITVLERSDRGNWFRIRLPITGEEGWFPVRSLDKTSVTSSLWKTGRLSFEGSVGFGTLGHNVGFDGTITFNTYNNYKLTESETRFEVGGYYSIWGGEKFSRGASSIDTSYQIFGGLIRYAIASESGHYIAAFELGAGVRKADFETNGLGTFDADAEEDEFNGFGLMAGARGWYALSSKLLFHVGVRSHIAEKTTIFVLGGVSFRL